MVQQYSCTQVTAFFRSAFDGEHCYEPYVPHGNFSSSDMTFPLGTTVTFSCSPGFIMEQGSGVMECVDPSDPHWNESEPVCRGMASSFHFYKSTKKSEASTGLHLSEHVFRTFTQTCWLIYPLFLIMHLLHYFPCPVFSSVWWRAHWPNWNSAISWLAAELL